MTKLIWKTASCSRFPQIQIRNSYSSMMYDDTKMTKMRVKFENLLRFNNNMSESF